MKMSPPCEFIHRRGGVWCRRKDSHFSFQRFVELHFGAGEAEAFGLGRDLEAAAVPLHDIVVADRAFVNEAADAFQIPGSGAPGFFGLAWCAAEAPVVVGKEAAENFVGRWEIARASQPQFAGEAILKGAPRGVRCGLWPAGERAAM